MKIVYFTQKQYFTYVNNILLSTESIKTTQMKHIVPWQIAFF